MKIHTLYFLLFILLIGCRKAENISRDYIQPEEYEIFSTVLETFYPIPQKYHDKILFVLDSTYCPSTYLDTSFSNSLPRYDWKTIKQDYSQKNRNNSKIDSGRIFWRVPVCLVSKQNYQKVIRKDSSSIIYRLYKDSLYRSQELIKLSRVGFDSLKSIAIVHFEFGVPGGGIYGFFVLKKEFKKWVIIKEDASPWI